MTNGKKRTGGKSPRKTTRAKAAKTTKPRTAKPAATRAKSESAARKPASSPSPAAETSRVPSRLRPRRVVDSLTPVRRAVTPGRAASAGGGVSASEDRTFNRVLATRASEKIVPEAGRRLEAGRQRYVSESLSGARAELEIVEAERKRIEKEGDATGRKLARLEQIGAAVEADIEASRTIAEAIERAVEPVPGGWTVVGRVLGAKGRPPKKAQVVFVDEAGKLVKMLEPIGVEADGMVRQGYTEDVVAPLAKEGLRVRAAVRVGRRTVATDSSPVRVQSGGLYQFDLRVAERVQ